jgi:hypothetical protein
MRTWWITAVLLAGAGLCSAQTVGAPDFLAVDSAFAQSQFEKAELLALRILGGGSALTPDEAARLYLTAGYSAIMLGREDDARTYFAKALDAVPDLELDPVQVSPKFRVVFDEVKSQRPARVPPEPVTNPQIMSRDSLFAGVAASRKALLSNLIVPGSGQWLEGRKARGLVCFGLQAASVGILVWRLNELRDSRADYLAETDPARVSNAYDSYNRDYRSAWIAGLASGLVYLTVQADLIRLQSAQPRTPAISVGLGKSQTLALRIGW